MYLKLVKLGHVKQLMSESQALLHSNLFGSFIAVTVWTNDPTFVVSTIHTWKSTSPLEEGPFQQECCLLSIIFEGRAVSLSEEYIPNMFIPKTSKHLLRRSLDPQNLPIKHHNSGAIAGSCLGLIDHWTTWNVMIKFYQSPWQIFGIVPSYTPWNQHVTWKWMLGITIVFFWGKRPIFRFELLVSGSVTHYKLNLSSPVTWVFLAAGGSQIAVGWLRGIGGIYTYRSPRTTVETEWTEGVYVGKNGMKGRSCFFLGGEATCSSFMGFLIFFGSKM